MRYSEVLRFFGGMAKAAQAIGVSPSAVCQWKAGGISYLRQLDIERLTQGRLKADVRDRRQPSRPSLYQRAPTSTRP